MKLYYSPVSSYSQKALIAFYEKDVPFTPVVVNLMDPAARAAYEAIHPLGKVPFLYVEENDWRVPESTTIIEWLEDHYPNQGTKLIPDDRHLARQVRFRDRFADNYLNEPMQKIFFDGRKPVEDRDPKGVAAAEKTIDKAYKILEMSLGNVKGPWAMGENYSMADCSMTPCLNYLRMVRPFSAYPNITSYANRLMERASFMKVMAEAAPILAQMMKG